VRVSETSRIELISKLKHIVNLTAEEIGEIVDQSHEIAIGLAEHFDVLQKVSKGELNARFHGSSQIELLDSLKNVTNEMIESISREITERKRTEGALRERSNDLWKRVKERIAFIAFPSLLKRKAFRWKRYFRELLSVFHLPGNIQKSLVRESSYIIRNSEQKTSENLFGSRQAASLCMASRLAWLRSIT
jgi:hypothetical protein